MVGKDEPDHGSENDSFVHAEEDGHASERYTPTSASRGNAEDERSGREETQGHTVQSVANDGVAETCAPENESDPGSTSLPVIVKRAVHDSALDCLVCHGGHPDDMRQCGVEGRGLDKCGRLVGSLRCSQYVQTHQNAANQGCEEVLDSLLVALEHDPHFNDE